MRGGIEIRKTRQKGKTRGEEQEDKRDERIESRRGRGKRKEK